MSTPIGSSQWMYASGEAVTQQSLKFNDDESQYLSWTPAAAGNRKTYTISLWFKRANISIAYPTLIGANVSSGRDDAIRFGGGSGGDDLYIFFDEASKALKTNRVFRDTASWYHLVLAVDTTQATDTNRVKVYINGVQETSFASATYPAQNYEGGFSRTAEHSIGKRPQGNYFDGYLSDINFIDGQALDASSFGETVDGYWKAKDYAGTYGTNGFRLSFQDDVVSEGFNAVTYRGTGQQQSLSGFGLSPDLVWFKRRTASGSHRLIDSVRGATKNLASNLTNAEATSSDMVLSFDADGVTIGTNTAVNNAEGHVCWAWDAGSGSSASNTDGSITSTVKANPSYGFSVVTASASGTSPVTVGHGLGVQPKMIIGKVRDVSSTNWYVYSSQIAASDYLVLNSSAAKATSSNIWDTAPTSTVFTVGNPQNGWSAGNSGTHNYVFYCFSEVSGYSSIGSYSGTGSAGNVVNCGFRPAWLLVKDTTSTGNWFIYDNTRSVDGTYGDYLRANLSDAEGNFDSFVATSTGFETLGSALNTSGNTFIYMAFADTREAAFWKDVSGQGNNWTPNNLDYRDSLIDSPANNFATLNPLFTNGGSTQNFKEGNLQFTADGNYALAHGTFAMRTGKWYWETYIKSWVSVPVVGISRGTNTAGNSYVGYDPNGNVKSFGYESGGIIYGASGVGTSAGSQLASGLTTYTTGDVIGCSFDADVGELKFYKNGTLIYTVYSIDEFDWMPATSAYNGGINIVNFGQDSTFSGARPAGGNTDANNIGDFAYAPPSGYLALCTANLPEPTIVDGSEHFNTVLYTGTGSQMSITGVGFQPDFFWNKSRSATGSNAVNDSVRGANARLNTDSTAAETTQSGFPVSYDSDGVTLNSFITSGKTYVLWNWLAGTAFSNDASATGVGTIDSEGQVNTTAGFSITTYTEPSGTFSFKHGLGVQPDMFVFKNRDSTENWIVWHKDFGSPTNNGLYLNSTNGQFATGSNWLTAIDSNTISITSGQIGSAGAKVCYSFASIEGYSKVGSYTGNGSSDGTFVYTGFRPAFWMMKSVSDATHWVIYDSARETFNAVQDQLLPNATNAEAASGRPVDFLSNGVKLRFSSYLNDNGQTYIYLAFAENPFKYANAR